MAADTTPAPVTEGETSQPPPPQRPLYEASTQYRNWRFSPQQLITSRKLLSEAAIQGIKDLLEKESVREHFTARKTSQLSTKT